MSGCLEAQIENEEWKFSDITIARLSERISALEAQMKVKPQIRVMKADLKDLIRDEIYGAATEVNQGRLDEYILLPKAGVKKIAKRIADRAIVGH